MAYVLQQLLRESARQFPENTAAWAQNRTISYRELENQSNQLAHLLAAQGVKKGDRVGLYFSKSIESLVSIFGVLKAGAAYVPLDPHAPVRRVEYIARNCNIRALITTRQKLRGLTPNLLAGHGSILLLDGAGDVSQTEG